MGRQKLGPSLKGVAAQEPRTGAEARRQPWWPSRDRLYTTLASGALGIDARWTLTCASFAAFLCVSGCKATSAELEAVRCDPTVDVGQCDDEGIRAMECNPANGQWTPVEMCYAPTVCQTTQQADGTWWASCGLPGTEDASAGTDSESDGGSTGKDGSSKDSTTKDTGGKDTSASDADDATGEDSEDIATEEDTTTPLDGIPNLACLQKYCPSQLAQCKTQAPCVQAATFGMDCLMTCGGGQSCFSQCQSYWSGNSYAFSLMNCGLQCAAGCGDGICATSETSTTCPKDCKPETFGSCLGNCGGLASDCHCDLPCLKLGDCCADYAEMCK